MYADVENYYEHLVFSCLQRLLSDSNSPIDPESDHVADIACIALNRLPPRYVRHFVDATHHLGENEILAVEKEVEEAVVFALGWAKRRPGDRS